MKCRKKPVIVEAFKFDGDLMNSHGKYYIPEWAVEAHKSGILHFGVDHQHGLPYELFVETLEGTMKVDVGDYVIKGVKGELYPCKPDIFDETYDIFSEISSTEIVTSAKIIVHGTTKPYYEIKYIPVGEKKYHVGYSSYDLYTVLQNLVKYFKVLPVETNKEDNMPDYYLTDSELKSIKNAVVLISSGECTRVDLGNNTIIYKVPSPNPKKYTIRMDINVKGE